MLVENGEGISALRPIPTNWYADLEKGEPLQALEELLFAAKECPGLVPGKIRQTPIWYLSNNVYIGSAWGPTLPASWSLTAP